jgi:hypothetical protein
MFAKGGEGNVHPYEENAQGVAWEILQKVLDTNQSDHICKTPPKELFRGTESERFELTWTHSDKVTKTM